MDDVTRSMLDNLFTYHPPQPGLPAVYQEIRDHGRRLAEVIVLDTPAGPDQKNALDHIRAAVMWANAALATATAAEQDSIVTSSHNRWKEL